MVANAESGVIRMNKKIGRVEIWNNGDHDVNLVHLDREGLRNVIDEMWVEIQTLRKELDRRRNIFGWFKR